MKGLMEKFISRLSTEDGASAMECSLLIFASVLAVMLAIYALGGDLITTLTSVKNELGG